MISVYWPAKNTPLRTSMAYLSSGSFGQIVKAFMNRNNTQSVLVERKSKFHQTSTSLRIFG